VVGYLTHNSKIKGANPTTGTGRERNGNIYIYIYIYVYIYITVVYNVMFVSQQGQKM
jgi:hypothetical protein